MAETRIKVRTETMATNDINLIRYQVDSWVDAGYTSIAIMYFLGQRYKVSQTYEGGLPLLTVNSK